jgi:hypothetical protein
MLYVGRQAVSAEKKIMLFHTLVQEGQSCFGDGFFPSGLENDLAFTQWTFTW